MDDSNDSKIDLGGDGSSSSHVPMGLVAVAIIALFVILTALILHGKSKQKERDATQAVLRHELEDEQRAVQDEKEKIVDITKKLETMKQKFQLGLVKDKDKPASTKAYNDLAAQQRSERDKYTQMAQQYNEKIVKLQQEK